MYFLFKLEPKKSFVTNAIKWARYSRTKAKSTDREDIEEKSNVESQLKNSNRYMPTAGKVTWTYPKTKRRKREDMGETKECGDELSSKGNKVMM